MCKALEKGVQKEIPENKSLKDVDYEHARPNKCCFC